jgi:formate/nitrite transporter
MSVTEEMLAGLKPDVSTPAETEAKLEAIGVRKAGMPLHQSIPLGILAGLFIAMGGMMLGLVLSDATLPFAVQRLLGGLSFCIGLVLVLLAGAELFTGNNLIIAAVGSGKVSWGAYAKNLVIIWLANLVGSLIAVAIVFLASTYAMNGGTVGDTFVKLAEMKVSLAPMPMFFKGILCNFLVCLAVWLSFAGRTFADKFLAVIFPITAFVAAGAEHCVANMFFLPLGLLLKVTGNYSDGIVADHLDIGGVLYNLGIVTVGNMVGGIVLVGLIYWFALHKRTAKQ